MAPAGMAAKGALGHAGGPHAPMWDAFAGAGAHREGSDSGLVYRSPRHAGGVASGAAGLDRDFVWSLTQWMAASDKRHDSVTTALALQNALLEGLVRDSKALLETVKRLSGSDPRR